MSYADDLAALVNALVEDHAKELAARKTGKPVPGGVGSSLGGTTLSTDGVIDQGENTNSGGGTDENNNEGAKEPLKEGDEPEKFKLFDCETGEEVTIDGLGGGGAGPAYPTGFEDCKGQVKPTLEELIQNNVTIYRSSVHYDAPNETIPANNYYYTSESSAQSGLPALKSSALAYANGKSQHGCEAKIVPPSDGMLYGAWAQWKGQSGQGSCSDTIGFAAQVYGISSSNSVEWKQAYLDNWGGNDWPAPDKNHLVWNEEKGCMEPLCPDLNTQVSEKYKGCNDEMVLCDEEGNKVKVTIENGEMKVTQAKHGQEATIKNGKVQSTKPLTSEQIARAFK